ncbi:MAG: DUF3782 domain-containing protein [Magnetococcales bacterium]|nr:DUF3782 domain-containing protein [Magnetococcales bacterium]
MPETVTLDDVWKAFMETDRKMQETDRRMQETDRRMQETDRRMRETDQRMLEMRRETERMIQEASERSREAHERELARFREAHDQSREAYERSREAHERELAQSREARAETERVVKDVSRQIGNLGSRWGEFVEGLVAPACETIFADRGIPVHRVAPRVKIKSRDGTRRMEIDLFVDNTDNIVLVEVKSRLTVDDVRDHLQRVREFKEFFTKAGESQVMGAVAGIVIDDGADRFAMNEGLFVIV